MLTETRTYTFLSLKNLSIFPIKLKWKVLIAFKPPKKLGENNGEDAHHLYYCQQYFHNDFKTRIIYFQTIENE
jgi:hypothetical protein